MRSFSVELQIAALALLFSSSIATPLNTHVSHEKRSFSENSAWRQSSRVAADSIVPLRIGLTQSNLEHGASHLESIADPTSPSYGQHLTADEVHSLFAPAESTVEAVRNWLLEAGFKAEEIVHSDNKGWLALDVPASSVESLFQTSLHEYEHGSTGSLRLGCEEYHVPAHLAEHIDYVTPGVKLSAMVRKRSDFVGKRSIETFKAASASLQSRSTDALPKNLRNCSNEVTPDCLRALYNLPTPSKADQANAPAFFEQGDYYAQKDLDGFFAKYATQIKSGTAPKVVLIDGAVDPSQNATLEPITGEQEGDVEVAFGLVYPTIPIVYQVDDPYYAQEELDTYNLFNTFLDALDGSYCNYTAYGITGDSWRDVTYPDPQRGGYKGKLQCGVYKPATVISISYGEAEYDIPIRYDRRQCNEWMKLSLQGHTIFTASGDYGVAGFPHDGSKKGPGTGAPNGCLPGSGQAPAANNSRVFNPDYLSSCPYITSVGATMIPQNGSVTDGEVAAYVVFPGNQIYSGAGGFSNYFRRPKFQDAAIEEYFAKHDPGYKHYVANEKATNVGARKGLYNRAGRGFPDVSANGAYLGLDLGGQTGPVGFGTSFASPIWASTISLINTARSKAGKKSVGWINPTLYKNPSAMNDITSGVNPGCGTQGFEAVEGWDPNTGLGTPNYEKLLKVFMDLP